MPLRFCVLKCLQSFLPQAERMSGFAVQIKQLQRLPHAYSVHVV